MAAITKVALAGATGNLGPAVLEQLIKAGFEVTVLTRETSSHSFAPSVTVAKVDYGSLDSLTKALTGQDALVSTLATTSIDRQLLLVEAAAKAGVKRFIPSEFGSDTLNEKTARLPVFQNKVAVLEALKKEAAAGRLTYSAIITGPFFDWGLSVGFILNLKGKSASLYDGGGRPVSTTTLEGIGQAVAGALRKPGETENRVLYVHSATVSQLQLLEKAKKATGPGGWTEDVVSIESTLEEANAELEKENPDPAVFGFKFIIASIFGEGYGQPYQKTDNELLGVPQLSDEEVQALVEKLAK